MGKQKFELNTRNQKSLQQQLLQACGQHQYSLFLHSNGHQNSYSRYSWMAAFGHRKILTASQNSFEKLRQFCRSSDDWLLGHLSFELKNEVEKLSTSYPAKFSLPHLSFFVPETLVYATKDRLICESYRFANEHELSAYLHSLPADGKLENKGINLEAQVTRDNYLQHVEALKEELQYGNIYEINYCIELAAHARLANPVKIFEILNRHTRAPFAAFYKHDKQYLLCASPERFLQKQGEKIISQPIKGTAPRMLDPEEDERAKRNLRESEKERSENVMITDLVRNDLSRTAQVGSVKTEELFGIYSFTTVHQMISTVSSRLDSGYDLSDVLATSFPMGSMTGAPKVKALELIDRHENFARQLYSGSVGYISPSGDCDFNVVIRSLLYNDNTSYLSARVGSAITIKCDAAAEYRECLLKAGALLSCLRDVT